MRSNGGTLNSDSWTDVNGRPFINTTICTWQGAKLLSCVDASGAYKDATYIADLVCKTIELEGPKNIVAVCMDNAPVNIAAFALIMARYTHIVCVGCVCHIAALLAGSIYKELPGALALIQSCHLLVMFVKNICAVHTMYRAVTVKLHKKLELIRLGNGGCDYERMQTPSKTSAKPSQQYVIYCVTGRASSDGVNKGEREKWQDRSRTVDAGRVG